MMIHFKNSVLLLLAIVTALMGAANQTTNSEELHPGNTVFSKAELVNCNTISENQNNTNNETATELFDIEEEEDEESLAKHFMPLVFAAIIITFFIVSFRTQLKLLLSGNKLLYFNSFRSLNVAFCNFRL